MKRWQVNTLLVLVLTFLALSIKAQVVENSTSKVEKQVQKAKVVEREYLKIETFLVPVKADDNFIVFQGEDLICVLATRQGQLKCTSFFETEALGEALSRLKLGKI